MGYRLLAVCEGCGASGSVQATVDRPEDLALASVGLNARQKRTHRWREVYGKMYCRGCVGRASRKGKEVCRGA